MLFVLLTLISNFASANCELAWGRGNMGLSMHTMADYPGELNIRVAQLRVVDDHLMLPVEPDDDIAAQTITTAVGKKTCKLAGPKYIPIPKNDLYGDEPLGGVVRFQGCGEITTEPRFLAFLDFDKKSLTTLEAKPFAETPLTSKQWEEKVKEWRSKKLLYNALELADDLDAAINGKISRVWSGKTGALQFYVGSSEVKASFEGKTFAITLPFVMMEDGKTSKLFANAKVGQCGGYMLSASQGKEQFKVPKFEQQFALPSRPDLTLFEMDKIIYAVDKELNVWTMYSRICPSPGRGTGCGG